MENDLRWLASMSDDVLESEIRGLASRVAAAMCRFLLAVAEFDRRRGWERWECHDLASWLSWKCGISPVTSREYGRVARALGDLPLVLAEFAAGRLSYSQVRAVSRVATPATEEALVELASVSTAAQLERVCRGYQRCGEKPAEEEEKQDRVRFLHCTYDDDGCLVGNFRLAPDVGALFAGAISEQTTRADVAEADRDGAADPFSAAQADAMVDLITAGRQALTQGSDDGSDDRFLVTVIAEPAALAEPGDAEPGEPGAAGANAPLCHIDGGPALSGHTARRIACDASTVRIIEDRDGNVLDVGRRTRRINRRLRRALARRDRGCRYPGCDRKGYLDAHHIWHWTDGGPTNMKNLISLCRRHHHRVHEGGYIILRLSDGSFEFQHPNGWIIPPTPDDLMPEMSRLGWEQPDAYQDGWDGTRLDLSGTVACLTDIDRASAEADKRRNASAEASDHPDDSAEGGPPETSSG